jgi:putative ABC transport system permease protein
MVRDAQLAFRSLVKAPGFTAAALLTLALGIGATTVVFGFVNGLLLRPLPFGEATERIVSLHGTHPTQLPDDWDDAGVSYADMWDVRREGASFEDVAVHFEKDFTLYGEEAVRVLGGVVTPNLFGLLGARPALGRDFRTDEGARLGFERVVIISEGLWRTRFGADPNVVGEPILINERELIVIGIMPAGFRFPERSDLWLPHDPGEGSDRAARYFLGVAKLESGTRVAEARLELESIAERLANLHPETNRGWALHALPYRDRIVRSSMRVTATALLGAIGFVLLIGCANLASLLLARETERQREIAVRSALGAGRARLVRQMLVESLILGCTGGALGTLLAAWGLEAIVASFPEELPYWLSFQIDWRVASFIVLLSVVSSIAFGLVPALRVSKVDLTAALGSGRDPKAGRRSLQLQSGLIVGQVAVSLALLVGAGLMYQSFLTVSAADPGFDQKPLLTMRIYLAGDAYDPTSAKTAFFRGIVERLREVPGVSAATATSAIPSEEGGTAARVVTREHPVADGSELGLQVIGSTPGFFETLDVDLLSGRVFDDRDLGEEAPPVAIVNESLAIRLWPGQRAENQEIGLVRGAGIDWLRVIGVAPNIQYEEFGEERAQSQMNVFVPYSRIPYREMALLVRAEQDPAALAEPVRDALKSFAPGAPLFLVRTMEQVRFMTSWENRFFSRLFNAFGLAAVFLACLGVYGLVAYRSGRRTHEIGIRVALGADNKDVVRLLLRQGVVPAGIGITIGLALSYGVRRILLSVLYQSSGYAELTLAAATLFTAAVVLASYLPARRAASLEPMRALRQD